MKVSLLTIGTEITTGEILNTNSQWLSERLEAMGMEIQHHLTVPDHQGLILEALDFLSSSNLLVVTGGLGPTQDDLTREAVSQWAHVDLEFSEDAWRELQERLGSRHVTCRPAHKQQCYFPKACRILKNSVGSAHGFELTRGSVKVEVLPGPPRELQPMWMFEVEPHLGKGSLTPWVKWTFHGLAESDVAARFEALLSEFIDPRNIEIGYRATMPDVHVKVRQAELPQGFKEKVEREFAPFLKK